ncbi:FUSC family protein [Shewanella sp. YLB-07]|uniref:FUSC family protein n=1 Tax=Shewanella sp. YLB-07 TaxID=2601268 RepID=UPI00128E6F03|nr:FUSC family protein [Shewanella sp. YLB-07]MPY25375.1 hypothetical protein [Shewanella sp. YLB-07]
MNYWGNKEATQFALRVSISVIVTWLICLRLNSEATSAAMISIIIILMAGSHGANLIKSFYRAVGTILASAFVLFVSSTALIDAWLFNGFMILWIVTCVGLAAYLQNSVSYVFGMAGMTAAVIGFPLAYSPEIISVFDNVQARCFGILIGIAVSIIVTAVIPYEDDIKRILPIKKATLKFIAKVFSGSTPQKSQQAFSQYLGLISNNKQIPINSLVGSKASLELIKSQRDALFHCVSLAIAAIKIRHMLRAADDTKLEHLIAEIIEEIHGGELDTQLLFDKIKIIVDGKDKIQIEKGIQADIINKHLAVLIENLIWLNSDRIAVESQRFKRQVSRFFTHTDLQDVLRSMLRAALLLSGISFIWIEGQWEHGMNAMLMAGMLCSMNATLPNAKIGNTKVLLAQLIMVAFGFLITFAIAPLLEPKIMFPVMFVYLLITSYQFVVCTSANKSVWRYMLIFWSSYIPLSNIPTLDFGGFLNTAMANVFAVMMILAVYMIIPSRKDTEIVIHSIKRTLKKLKPNSGNSDLSSDLILSAYPVLVRQDHTKVYIDRLISIGECFKLSELDLLTDDNRVLIRQLLSSILENRHNEDKIRQLQRIAETNMQRHNQASDHQAYSAWWQLNIALKRLCVSQSMITEPNEP